MDLETNLYFEL